MATQLEDFRNQVLLQTTVFPASVNDTNNGTSVDMIDGDGRCFAVQVIGQVTGSTPALVGKIQESSDNATWVDIPNATFTSVGSSNSTQSIVFDRTRRFLRHFRTVTGTTPAFFLSSMIGQQRKLI
jgi:hypothetical protein